MKKKREPVPLHPYWELKWHQARLTVSSLRREIKKTREHYEKFGPHTFKRHSPWIGNYTEASLDQIIDLRVWAQSGKKWR